MGLWFLAGRQRNQISPSTAPPGAFRREAHPAHPRERPFRDGRRFASPAHSRNEVLRKPSGYLSSSFGACTTWSSRSRSDTPELVDCFAARHSASCSRKSDSTSKYRPHALQRNCPVPLGAGPSSPKAPDTGPAEGRGENSDRDAASFLAVECFPSLFEVYSVSRFSEGFSWSSFSISWSMCRALVSESGEVIGFCPLIYCGWSSGLFRDGNPTLRLLYSQRPSSPTPKRLYRAASEP